MLLSGRLGKAKILVVLQGWAYVQGWATTFGQPLSSADVLSLKELSGAPSGSERLKIWSYATCSFY